MPIIPGIFKGRISVLKAAGGKNQINSPQLPQTHRTWEHTITKPESIRKNPLGIYALCPLPSPPPSLRSTPTPAAVIELSPAPIPPPATRATWETRPCQAPPASENGAAKPESQKSRGYTRLRRGAPDTVIRRNSHAPGRTETTCHDIFNAPPSLLFSTPSLARPSPPGGTQWSFWSFESFGHCRMRGSPGAGPANQSAVCLPWPMADATLLSNSV